MDSLVDASRTQAALLSAATPSQSGISEPPSLLKLAGEPLIAHQMRALAQRGVTTFFVEVDQVPGALLAYCDDARSTGLSVELVRSTQELHEKLPRNATLLVLGEAIYANDGLFEEVMTGNDPFVITVDGRDENGAFERMDLNTRWAGLARVDMSVVQAVAHLPAGWSIASSLLRQAIQQRIPQKKLAQIHVQKGDLMVVSNAALAEDLTTGLLSKRAASVGGIIESRIFAPIAARLAKPFWRNNINAAVVPAVTLLSATGSVVLGYLGYAAGGAAMAFASIFGLTLNATLSPTNGANKRGWLPPFTWLLLAAALAVSMIGDLMETRDNLFAAGIFAALLVHSRQIDLPEWARSLLISLGLPSLVLLIFGAMGQIGLGVKTLVILHLALLIFVGFRGNAEPK